MQVQTPITDVQLQHSKIGHLESFTIQGNGFRAVVLRQGAQLIHFSTDDMNENQGCADNPFNNWLWVSDAAEYNQGESVRGGIPICWPVFGQFAANPQAVKNSFVDCPFDLSQHGYARTQLFALDSFESFTNNDVNESAPYQSARLILTLQPSEPNAPHLDLKVEFVFSQHGFAITLITQNNSTKSVTFSQALHTYLPTKDITKTTILGFDGIAYSDTLINDIKTGGWQTKMQQGDISFNSEVDRIYHTAPDITLNTPEHSYLLQAKGSNSTVIWNPWRDKAKTISQMGAEDYQRMLCIETANAHLDSVCLQAGGQYSLELTMQRVSLNEG